MLTPHSISLTRAFRITGILTDWQHDILSRITRNGSKLLVQTSTPPWNLSRTLT